MMRLRSFQISNFRKFDRPVRLEGLGDGINVLAEPNERGKSTLLAALKAVLFEQHRTKGKVGEAMRHFQHATSPVLSLEFDLADGRHRIEKRFMHREPYARLALPNSTRVEGDAAEERLQAILGFGAPGVRGATSDSLGLWGALWVAQQDAVRQPDLSASGHATLNACLEAELGTLTGQSQSGALTARVKTELSALLDGNSRPKGRLKEVGEQIITVDAAIAQLRTKRTGLNEAVDTLTRLRADLAQASDADADRQLADDLTEARRLRDVALQHQNVLRGAIANLGLAERSQTDASAETDRRTSRRQRIVATRPALEAARNDEARLLEEQVAAATLLTQRRDAVRLAEEAVARAAELLRDAHAKSALVMRSGQLVRLGGALERATTAQAEVNRLTGELAANPADAARLGAVITATGALDRARSVLDAQATEIVLDLEPAAAGKIRLGGAVLPTGPSRLRVVEDAALEIAGIGRMRVEPAIRDRVKLQMAVVAAETALATALLTIGASDPAEAVSMAADRSGLADRIRAAEAVLAAETPGEPTIELKPGLEALRNRVDADRSQLAAELAALGLKALPTAAEAATSLEVAEQIEVAARAHLADTRAALVAPEAEHERAAVAQGEAVLQAGQARSGLIALERDEAAALATEADDVLATRLAAAHAEVAGQRALVAQLQGDKPAETVEGMDARIKRLEGAGNQRVDTVRRLREEIAGLVARIRHDEGEGLDEQIAEAERRREELAGEQAALQRDMAVLTLLRGMLIEAEREARERYVAPVLRRVTPYLQGLFPGGVEVSLGDQLRIATLTRQAGAEDLERLSVGTTEQIAVMLRLAYADLLIDAGKPAMLILDDALAYADRGRLELVFDALTKASERMQILVLTCRTDAFSRLGGNRIKLVEA